MDEDGSDDLVEGETWLILEKEEYCLTYLSRETVHLQMLARRQ